MKKIFALITVIAFLTACGGARQEEVLQNEDSIETALVDSATVKIDTAVASIDTTKATQVKKKK